jgi:hypothetical protein
MLLEDTMKKIIVIFSFLYLFVSSIFALDATVGIGYDYGLIFNSINTNLPKPYDSSLQSTIGAISINRGSLYSFVSLKFIEANIGWKYSKFSYTGSDDSYEETQHYFSIGLNMKYPFKIFPTGELAPIIGFDYSLFTTAKMKLNDFSETIDRKELSIRNDYDRFAVNIGIVLDCEIMKHIVFRTGLNYAVLFNTEAQKNLINLIELAGYRISIFQSGPKLIMAIGYKF